MWRIIPYAILQCVLLTGGQVLLKFALQRMLPFAWSREFWGSMLTNWHFAASGVLFAAASLLWMYILKVFPFSTAYPMVSLSYVFGMLAAIVFFHEEVSVMKWAGVLLIMLGCTLTAQGQTEAQMRREIQAVAQSVKSMQCDFEQTKQLSLLNDRLVSKGRMSYRQGDQLCWEYLSPYSYAFILNGSQVLLRNDRRSKVIDTRQNKQLRELVHIMMTSVMGSSLTSGKDFHVTLKAEDGQWVATLQPQRRDLRRMFRQVRLFFDKSRKLVSRVELTEKKGDMTVIELKNVKTNVPIADETFKSKIENTVNRK